MPINTSSHKQPFGEGTHHRNGGVGLIEINPWLNIRIMLLFPCAVLFGGLEREKKRDKEKQQIKEAIVRLKRRMNR